MFNLVRFMQLWAKNGSGKVLYLMLSQEKDTYDINGGSIEFCGQDIDDLS